MQITMNTIPPPAPPPMAPQDGLLFGLLAVFPSDQAAQLERVSQEAEADRGVIRTTK